MSARRTKKMNDNDYEQKLVANYRKKGYEITEQDLEIVRNRCESKIHRINISNRQIYMPLLFADELKDYIYCKTINSYFLELNRISQELAKVAEDIRKKMEVFQDVRDM